VRIVVAAAALAPGELGAFLRREGVHEADVEQWRSASYLSPTGSPTDSAEEARKKETHEPLARATGTESPQLQSPSMAHGVMY
jgi:hypothetical protein